MQDTSTGIPLRSPAEAANVMLSLQRSARNTLPDYPGIPSAANLPSSIFTNPSIQPSSVINLSNSSDVVIGPQYQYQGPVTIYQYMDATVEARALNSNTGLRQTSTNNSTNIRQNFTKSSTLALVLGIALIIVCGVTIYLVLLNKSSNTDKDRQTREILFGNDYDSGTIPNLGNGHLVIDRTQWGASEHGRPTIPLEHPIPYVLLTHVGVQSSPCYNVYKCSIKMRSIQDSSIAEKNLTDISANFYVADDGNIYVGRGWNFANTYTNKTLALAFLGDYVRNNPDPKQLEAAQYLLAYALTKQYLALDYKLVALNQTKQTRSPGPYVYKHIVKWPHFYPCGMNGNPKCGSEIGLPEVWNANQ